VPFPYHCGLGHLRLRKHEWVVNMVEGGTVEAFF
jgi:hypothetical protein